MFSDDKPDPRFLHFTEIMGEDGRPIGFKLDKNDFLFKYDNKGGWHDEENNYYNAHGVFLYKEDEWDKEDVEEELVHEMEDLIKKEEGEDYESSESEDEPLPAEKDKEAQPEKPKKELTLQEKIFDTLDQIAKGSHVKAIKKGTPVKIYIKMRAASEVDIIKFDVSAYTPADLDKKIAEQRKKIDQKTEQLKKDLPKQAHITFSVQDGKIYWFGYIETDVQHFKPAFQEILKSKAFGILKRKTLLHLRFFITNEKALVLQKALTEKMATLPKDSPVQFKFTGIPELAPLSYMIDLLEECGLNAMDVQSILMKENEADVLLNHDKALRLLELQGFEKDEMEPIHLDIVECKQKSIDGEYLAVEFQNKNEPTIRIQKELLLVNALDSAFGPRDGVINSHPSVLKQLLHFRDEKLVPIKLEKIPPKK